MKKVSKQFAIAICAAIVIAAVVFVGCKKSDDSSAKPNANELSATELALIKDAGFNTSGATKFEGKYLVEGCFLLSTEELNNLKMGTNDGPEMVIANEEHYRTTNLVGSLPRTLRVRYTGTTTSISNAINAAIARYNARSLRVTFLRVTTSPYHITINNVSGVPYIASAGFPTGGNPYPTISFNTAYAGWGANTLTSVIAHEMGHCIGFRHTDYMDRSYSCGGSYYNEGAAGVGAIHIPGTPTGPSANSWMLACINNGINRPFTSSDNVALDYVY